MLLCPGCKIFEKLNKAARVKEPQGFSSAHRFEQTIEQTREGRRKDDRLVSIRLEGVPLPQAMRALTEASGKAIAWDASLDTVNVIGSFVDQPLSSVLEVVARRANTSVSEIDGIYYLGEYRSRDMATAVVRVPPVDREELKNALDQLKSENGKVSLVGSFIWLSDTFDIIRKILADLEEIRKRSERSYLAEVFFIRVNEDDFVQLTGDLRISGVDVFSSAFNIEELFQMFIDADYGVTSASVDTRPVLYLSEGRQSTIQVGGEITRERKAVNENGTIETTGYDKFNDGISLTLLLSRVSDERYSVNLDLEVSTFDRTDKATTIPAKKQDVLKSPGLLIRDGGIVYAGSLTRRDLTKKFGLISVDTSRYSDVLTIWVRVREIK